MWIFNKYFNINKRALYMIDSETTFPWGIMWIHKNIYYNYTVQ